VAVRKHWLPKLNGNAARDQRNQAALKKLGWHVMLIWECQTNNANAMERMMRRTPASR